MKSGFRVMRLGLFTALMSLFLAPAALRAHCGHCGVGEDAPKKEAKVGKHACGLECAHKRKSCPAHVDGAKVKVEKTDEGVVIRISAKDKDAVAKIQAAAEKMAKGECCSGSKGEHGKMGGKEHPRK